jgi:hypothetical protein
MAEEVKIDFTVDGAPAAKTLGELESKAEQLNAALRGAEIGSEEYKKLNQQLVSTNREVKNLELGFEALDNEQVASEIGSVAGAVGDVTSAMILLGGENESLAEMANNIQTAIGVSMAFKGAIEGFSSAFKLFNNVLKTSPIFLLVAVLALIGTGIAYLITKWDEFVGILIAGRDAVIGVFNAIIELFTGTEDAIVTASMAEKKAHEQRMAQKKEITKAHKERLAELEAERKANKEGFDERNEIFDLDIARMEAEGKNANLLKQEKIEAAIEFEKEELRIIQDLIASWTQYYEDQFAMSGKSREEFLKQMKGQGIDIEALQKESADLVIEQQRRIYSAETELIGFQRELREQAADDEVTTVEETLTSIEDLRNDFLGRLEAAENEFLNSQLDKQEQEENAVREKYFTLIEEAELYGESTLILEEAQAQALQDIKQKYNDAEVNAEKKKQDEIDAERQRGIEVAKKGAQDLLNATEQLANFQSERDLKRAQEKVARGERLTESEIKRLKRQEKINKAFALAQIAADTARGIAGAIAAGSTVPFPFNLGAIASGIAAVISGSVQAAQVLGESVEIPDVASVSQENSESESTNNVPDINEASFGSTLLNQQVYVVESDITDSQNGVNAIVSQATFG